MSKHKYKLPEHAITRWPALKEIVRKAGFTRYRHFLKSPMWWNKRSEVMSPGIPCSCCDARAEQAHHAYYFEGNVTGDSVEGIYPICKQCHDKIHHIPLHRLDFVYDAFMTMMLGQAPEPTYHKAPSCVVCDKISCQTTHVGGHEFHLCEKCVSDRRTNKEIDKQLDFFANHLTTNGLKYKPTMVKQLIRTY